MTEPVTSAGAGAGPLSGKVALVTGSTSGIGEAIVRHFAAVDGGLGLR